MEMLWTDLEIGDKVMFTKEYIDFLSYLEKYRDKELSIQKIEFIKDFQKLSVTYNGLLIDCYKIKKNGYGLVTGILVFKIVELAPP